MPRHTSIRHPLARIWLVVVAALMQSPEARAWSFSLQAASRRVFMYVGTATYTYNAQGKATGVNNNATVNTMVADLAPVLPSILANSTPQRFLTEPPGQTFASAWGSPTTCPTNAMIVGAGYQNSNSTPLGATLTLSSPAQLTSAAGFTIPFSNISWVAYSPDTRLQDSQWLSQGILGTNQNVGVVYRNSVTEVCFDFYYASRNAYPAGTYQGTITFTAYTP